MNQINNLGLSKKVQNKHKDKSPKSVSEDLSCLSVEEFEAQVIKYVKEHPISVRIQRGMTSPEEIVSFIPEFRNTFKDEQAFNGVVGNYVKTDRIAFDYPELRWEIHGDDGINVYIDKKNNWFDLEKTPAKGFRFFRDKNILSLSKFIEVYSKRYKVENVSENQNNLGLNKKIQKKFNDVDAVDNVSTIQFEDSEVERICHEHGVYTVSDARKVTSIKEWFSFNGIIESFIEFKYFTGLKDIEDNAFYNCVALQSINIPDGVTRIGADAFCFCDTLQSINIPDGVTSIEDNAFYRCSSLQSINIPDGVTYIEYSSFYKCTSLQSINIPNSVTSMGISAFHGCSSLQSIYISKNCPVYNQIRKAYSDIQLIEPKVNESSNLGLNSKVKKKFNDVDVVDNVAYIEFEDPEVERICHEHGVYTVDDAAKVSSILTDEKGWFDGYHSWFYKSSIRSFNEFKYFTGLKKLEKNTFRNCKSLQSISIPDSVTSIGDNTFSCCFHLQSINIPNSVTSIRDWAFSVCKSLQSIIIPNSVTSIGDYAFYNCSSLQSINIPDSVTSIGDYAFNRCESLQSINIPDNVISIGNFVFSRCSSLQSVNIPDGLQELAGYLKDLFCECTSLKTIYISKSNKFIKRFKAFAKKNGIQLVDKSINESKLGLNSKVKKKFDKVDAVDNVSQIPFEDPEVERICHEHGVYTVDDAAKVDSIKRWFTKNDSIKTFNELKLFKGLKKIENGAFLFCLNLSEITLPDNVTSIEDLALAYCRPLKAIEIPDKVTSIGNSAFWDCESLQEVKIPNNVYSIGPGAFEYCKSLKSINIPDKVISLKEQIISNCPKLETIYISLDHPLRSFFYGYGTTKLVDPNEVNESTSLGLNKHVQGRYSSKDVKTIAEEITRPLETPEEAINAISLNIIDLIPDGWYVWTNKENDYLQVISPSYDRKRHHEPLGVITFDYVELPSISLRSEDEKISYVLSDDKYKNRDILDNLTSAVKEYVDDFIDRGKNPMFDSFLMTYRKYFTLVNDSNRAKLKRKFISIDESNLGLNNKVQKKFDKVDAVDNINDYVDLGLPSGTLWCKHNYDEQEGYFNWNEVRDLNCDVIINHVPDASHFKELYRYCNVETAKIGDTCGKLFTSKINGKSIFFPALGYYWPGEDPNTIRSFNENGFYWSSTYSTAMCFFGHAFDPAGKRDKHLKFCVRTISKKTNENMNLGLNSKVKKKFDKVDAVENVFSDYVDLGLPSGTLWKAYNEGQEDIDEYLGHEYTYSEALKHYKKEDLPTKDQFSELLNHCDLFIDNVNGKRTVRFKSLINQNTLYFQLPQIGIDHYWSSSTPPDSSNTLAYALQVSPFNSVGTGINSYLKTNAFSIRTVINRKKNISESDLGLNSKIKKKFDKVDAIDNISEYVDLGLPSGNLWCTHNYEAREKTEYGEYLTYDEMIDHNLQEMTPTEDDWRELRDNCDLRFASYGDVNGIEAVSRADSTKRVFFPSGGEVHTNGDTRFVGIQGEYLINDSKGWVVGLTTLVNDKIDFHICIVNDVELYLVRFSVRTIKRH